MQFLKGGSVLIRQRKGRSCSHSLLGGRCSTPVRPGVGEVHLPVVSSGVLGTDDYHSVRMDGMISHQRKANSNADATRRLYLGLSRSAESRANSRGNKRGNN
ncbi:hypothetical protein NPIL_39111 [Nephila pilipes]|uniref:Uncharacterized protein n=1 Tax=Nephila pilipes TaxID=299642 RepID=A0A8X6TZJ0_NEPPI|nr:hypothetical protein NPIL_39111 [Nephila pilipes]